MKERRFAKRITKQLLKSHSVVSVEQPSLSGKALYREVLLHSQQVEPDRVDQVLRQAEDSYDEWDERDTEVLVFRQVVHSFAMSQYLAADHEGTVVSFKDIIHSLVPADL